MNGHSDTISKYFKTVISSKVGEQCNSEPFLEDMDRKEAVKKADDRIKELLGKTQWTPKDAGKIYFYDYLISINTYKENKSQYENQRKLIIKRIKQFCNIYTPNEKTYKLYTDLFGWLVLACQRGIGFLKDVRSSCHMLKSIIDNACSAEDIAREAWGMIPNSAKLKLSNMMIAETFDSHKNIGTCKKQEELESLICELKTSIDNIAYHGIALDIVGDHADIQELKYFSVQSRFFVLIDELFSRAEKLEKTISSNDCYGNKNISLKRSQTVRSILLDRLQPKKLMPSRDKLVNGVCRNKLYNNGFSISISIKINNEQELKRT